MTGPSRAPGFPARSLATPPDPPSEANPQLAMDPERWQRITAIFHDVLQHDRQHRAAILEEACASDPALSEEIERLLRAHDRAPHVIGTSAFEDAVQRLIEQPEPSAVGRRFGPYKVVAELGRGGMGAVYLAERADDQYEKRAAIKLVKRGMDTDAVLAQFRQERQILARLEHPNIARLLDGGTTDEGLPYFVMEHVEGLPIGEYCDQRRLSITERLLLFQQVCRAVSYAHQHLVVHRDLKPAHILVMADGSPKLLDFGIAKIVDAGGAIATRSIVGTLRLMTPEYASPEQVQGLPATTLSDVYSLGVVLYELLTRRSPYRFASRSPEDVVKAIVAADSDRPSDAVIAHREGVDHTPPNSDDSTGSDKEREEAQRLRRRLRGDLDTIVLKAMHKEHDRRYQSVDQFAEDIQRHLDGLPVVARSDTLLYRASKFVRRHTAIVTGAALVCLTLAGGIVATVWQAQRAFVQQARAERRFNDVRALARSVLFDYHEAIKDLPGATPVRARLVRDSLRYLDSLASEAGDDPSLQLELATAYERVADVQGGTMGPNLGDTRGAIASYRKAVQLREASLAVDAESFDVRRDLALAFNKLGLVIWETGDMGGALANIRRALTLLEPLAATALTDRDLRHQLARSHDHVGMILQEQGNTTAALDSYRTALGIFEDLSTSDPADPKVRRALSTTYEHVGTALLLTGDLEKARQHNRRALEMRAALAAEFPMSADHQRILLVSYYNEAEILVKMGRIREALENYQKDLTIGQQLAAADPSNELYRGDMAYAHIRIGDMRATLGDRQQALVSYRRSRALRAVDVKADPANLWKRSSLIEANAKIAKTLATMGRSAAALDAVKETVALMEQTTVEPTNAQIRSFFADAYSDLGQAQVAIASEGGNPAVRQKWWRAAHDLYGRSMAVWDDLRRRGILSPIDKPKLEAVSRRLARCERMLNAATETVPR
ncbi:MAG: protein kinase domain-containing protein [Vicinamibacteraceae bacterium]